MTQPFVETRGHVYPRHTQLGLERDPLGVLKVSRPLSFLGGTSHTHVPPHAATRAHMLTHALTCTCAHTHTMHTRTHLHTQLTFSHIYTLTHTCAHMCTPTHCSSSHTCIEDTCAHTCTQSCTHRHVLTFSHAHTKHTLSLIHI